MAAPTAFIAPFPMALLDMHPRRSQAAAGLRTDLVALMYHDVVGGDDHLESGFRGVGAAHYKLREADFRQHLRALWNVTPEAPAELRGARHEPYEGSRRGPREANPFALTFDDGGSSSITRIAPLLEALGWRGHFFVATDMIGQPGFLSPAEVRELHGRGHVVGSHSASHPMRLSALAPSDQYEEWRRSVAALGRLTGAEARVASVPNGFYSHDVARTASAAGIRVLFTSEPTIKVVKVDGCWVLGRYAVRASTTAAAAAALVAHHPVDRLKQSYSWSVKQLAKKVGGESYLKVRSRLLRRFS